MRINPQYPYSLYELGLMLRNEGNPEGEKMMQKAFEILKQRFELKKLHQNDYGWLASLAEKLGMHDFAEMVMNARPSKQENKFYNYENLAITVNKDKLTKKK